MRIIAGWLKGREFKTPHGHRTHPMSDKVKSALFNVLGDISGLTVLDSFAGSGALALEAVSRGAKTVIAVDKDSAAQKVLEQNVRDLQVGIHLKVIKANVAGWSIHNMEKRFDIVLLDPPYEDLQSGLLSRLIKRHVKKGGLAVLSYPGNTVPPSFDNCEVAVRKNYGDAQLVFFRKLK